MRRLQIPQKLVYEKITYTKKFYVHEISAVDLSKIYFLKNAKKTCKPNNRDLNRDWITEKKTSLKLQRRLHCDTQKYKIPFGQYILVHPQSQRCAQVFRRYLRWGVLEQ